MARVLVISDTQAPFMHKDASSFLEEVAWKYDCDRFVHIGDEADFYAISHYDSDPSHVENPRTELDRAIRQLRRLYEAFPETDVLNSNHKSRIVKRMSRGGLPKEWLKPYKELMSAPEGWNWHDHLIIDGVRYEHGDAFGGSSHTVTYRAPVMNRRSTVFGHFHAHANVMHHNGPEGPIFGMNVGCLMDRESYANAYFTGPRWSTLSCGVVLDGVPFIVPMEMGKSGKRWSRKVTS